MFKSGWYRFESYYHLPRFSNLRLYGLLLLSTLCESSVLNVTYVDPESGLVVQEQLAMLAGQSDYVTGILVPVQACEPLDTDAVTIRPFIALIENGGCKDQVKLLHVAQAHAAAALLYNDNPSTTFLQGNPIAFAVINQKKGEWLVNLIENGTRVWMQMGTFEDDHTPPTAILFVTIAFIILIIFSFVWLIQRFRYDQTKQILSRRRCSAGKTALDKIPVKKVKTDNRALVDDSECCAICIEPFHFGEFTRTLPCNHSFHKICIDPWLLEQRSCPMCKLDIILHFGLVYAGSEESIIEIDAEEFRGQRVSVCSEVVQRRHSGARVSISREGAASPCSVTSLDPDASAMEHSFDGAGNSSEIEYESNEERWTDQSQSYEVLDES